MQEAKIVVSSELAQEYPLLVSFPQGVPQHHADMAIVVGRKQSGKSARTVVTSSYDKVGYKGADYGEYTSKKDSCKYAVGIYDEKTKKMKLVRTDHVFVMKPQIESRTVVPRNSTMDYAQRRQSLTEEFGSRKKKRALAAEKSNTILTENISGAKSMQNILPAVTQSPAPQGTASAPESESKQSKRARK